MKKLFLALSFAVAALFVSGCAAEDYGRVVYSYGFSSVSSSDFEAMSTIQKAYADELKALDDATATASASIELLGLYSQCNKAVGEACLRAEKALGDFTPKDGYYVFEVTGLYFETAEEKLIYSKRFEAKN